MHQIDYDKVSQLFSELQTLSLYLETLKNPVYVDVQIGSHKRDSSINEKFNSSDLISQKICEVMEEWTLKEIESLKNQLKDMGISFDEKD